MLHVRPGTGHSLNPALTLRPLAGGSAQSTAPTTAVATRTVSITVGGQENRVLVARVAVLNDSSQTVDTVVSDVDGGFTLLDVQANGTSARVELWYLVGPTAGAHVITTTLAAAATALFNVSATEYYNVNQATPFGTQAKDTGTGTTASKAVTTALNDLLIDAVAKTNSTEPITKGAGQEQSWNEATANATAASNVIGGGSSIAGTGGSVTPAWIWSTTSRAWAMIAVPLKVANA